MKKLFPIHFRQIYLTAIHFRQIYLTAIHFRQIYLTAIHFRQIYLTGIHFRQIYLTGIFILLNIYSCNYSFAQWTWQNPLPQGNHLYSVYFTDANTGYAVGSGGTILKTTNGGSNWAFQTSGTNNQLFSVYFTDANTGYAVGGAGTILKISNGGSNWTTQTSGTTKWLESVYFTDANTGYAVGNVGTILKTSNGGSNWTTQTSGIYYDLSSVYFTDANTGYAVGENGTILKTTNGGNTQDINENKFSANDFTIYPNPSKGVFTIELPYASQAASLEVYNIMGTMVLYQSYKSEIDLSKSPKGIYFVKIYDRAKNFNHKIVVQ